MSNNDTQVPATPGWHEPPNTPVEAPGHDFMSTPGWHEPPVQQEETEETEDEGDSSLGSVVKRTVSNLKLLLSKEIKLIKQQSAGFGMHLAIALGAFVCAAVLSLFLLGYLLATVSAAFALVIPLWAAHLCTAGILLVIIALLALIGLQQAKSAKEKKPDVKSELAKTLQAAKKGLSK